MRPDLHEHHSHIDMQKIMMAVLVALQEERDRNAADAEAGVSSSTDAPAAEAPT